MIRLIISRYQESLFWLKNASKEIAVTVYNKNQKHLRSDTFEVFNIVNEGRESHTYLKHICENYGNLDNVMVFCQADPFEHNYFFLDKLAEICEIGLEKNILPLTYQWQHNHPPFEIIFDKRQSYYLETVSRFNLCPLRFLDQNIVELARSYRQTHSIDDNEDIIGHFCRLIDLPDNPDEPVHRFFYSGCFAVKREAILRHSKGFYERCLDVVLQSECHGYMFERIWYKMFGGE